MWQFYYHAVLNSFHETKYTSAFGVTWWGDTSWHFLIETRHEKKIHYLVQALKLNKMVSGWLVQRFSLRLNNICLYKHVFERTYTFLIWSVKLHLGSTLDVHTWCSIFFKTTDLKTQLARFISTFLYFDSHYVVGHFYPIAITKKHFNSNLSPNRHPPTTFMNHGKSL